MPRKSDPKSSEKVSIGGVVQVERDFRQDDLANEFNSISDPGERLSFCEKKLSDPLLPPEKQSVYALEAAMQNGYLLRPGEMSRWISFCEEIANLFESDILKLKIHLVKSNFYRITRQHDLAISELEAAKRILHSVYDPSDEMRIYSLLAHNYFEQNRLPEGISLSLVGLALAKKSGIKRSISQFLGFVSAFLCASGALEESIQYMLEGAVIAHELGDLNLEVSHIQNLGEAYNQLNMNKEARHCLEQALALIEPTSDDHVHVLILTNLTEICAASGAIAEANKFSKKALELSIQTGDQHLIAGAQIICALALLKAKKLEQAMALLLKAKEYSGPWNPNEERGLVETMSEVYSGLGNYQKAIEFEKKHLELIKKETKTQLDCQLKYREFLQKESSEKTVEILRIKEQELANSAIHLATQTEMLGNFRNEMRQIVREMNEPISALKKIKEKLKELPCESVDWSKFEKEFTAVHPEFRSKLTGKYPELTKQEIKMCQLARLGLKTYEMSRLLCLSERTVDGHRNGLRKKLGIKPQDNLKDFLQGIR